MNAGDEEVVSQEEGEGGAAEGEGGGCCCASAAEAIATAHRRAHRARENRRESPDLDRPGRQLPVHQQGLCEATRRRLGYQA